MSPEFSSQNLDSEAHADSASQSQENTARLSNTEEKVSKIKTSAVVGQYAVFVIIFTIIIGVFSLIMSEISRGRNDIYYSNRAATEMLYNGPIRQSAPSLGAITQDSELYSRNNLSIAQVRRFVENTTLKSTNAEVVMNTDFVKKGLTYQPTYQTSFSAEYLLKNELEEESVISFEFPFPVNVDSQEISNARLIVNGEQISNSKSKVKVATTSIPDPYIDPYYQTPSSGQAGQVDGLSWEGTIPADGEAVVLVSYDTVGLSTFDYQGIENPKGAQDFNFKVTINGTRSYNIVDGLSVTERNFGDNSVELAWNKPDLYSRPNVQVSIGDKLNPSTQVSRVYLTMAPVYFVFITILLYLAYRFGKNKLALFDMLLVTILFVVYFPLVHYLSSFTIDPTIEIFSSFKNVPNFSMPLYGAFLIAVLVIGGLMYYLLGKVSDFRFSTKFGIPAMILALGFFPLVVTIPEYSMLLVLIGVVALLAIIVQARVRTLQN